MPLAYGSPKNRYFEGGHFDRIYIPHSVPSRSLERLHLVFDLPRSRAKWRDQRLELRYSVLEIQNQFLDQPQHLPTAQKTRPQHLRH